MTSVFDVDMSIIVPVSVKKGWWKTHKKKLCDEDDFKNKNVSRKAGKDLCDV